VGIAASFSSGLAYHERLFRLSITGITWQIIP
jgi:hypothetical protein